MQKDIKINFGMIKRIIGGIMLFIVFTLMISHTLNTRTVQTYFSNGTLLILIASIIVYIFFRHKAIIKSNHRLLVITLIVFTVTVLYALINGTTREIENIMYIFISIIFLYKSNLNCSDIANIGLLIGLSSFYLARGYKSFEINSLGIIFSFGIVGLINFFDYYLKKRKTIILIFISIFSVLFITLTRMRGAVLAIIVICTYTIAQQFNTRNKKIIASLLIPLVLLFMWNIISNYLSEYLFFNKWGGTDITTGRINIWNYIFDNAGLFGIGYDYIPGYAHAHNTMMHLLARYGFIIWPWFLLLVCLIVYDINQLKKESILKNMCLRIVFLWFIFSITETIDLIKVPLYAPQFMLLLYFASLYNKENKYEPIKQNC